MTDGIFANGFQAALYVVDFDRLVHLRQFVDDVTDLVDHQIAGKVTVDFVNRFKIRNARLNAVDDSISGLHQGGRSFVARFDQLEFLCIKSRVDFFALFGQLNNELIELSEFPFELFDLDHHLGEVFVAAFG